MKKLEVKDLKENFFRLLSFLSVPNGIHTSL